MEKNNLPLDVISNSKKLEDGRTVLHVWTYTLTAHVQTQVMLSARNRSRLSHQTFSKCSWRTRPSLAIFACEELLRPLACQK